MKRFIGLIAAAMLMLGMFAVPAAADPDLGVFQGTADIGKFADCSKDGGTTPSGPGLTVPQPKDLDLGEGDPDKDRKYRLFTTVLFSVGEQSLGTLDVCGNITSVAGIGPRCGMSKGYNGKGLIEFDTTDTVYKVDELTWKASAGGTLPVMGKIWDYSEGTKEKPGTLVAEVQAQGSGCTTLDKNAGATTFTVVGAYEVLQNVCRTWNECATDEVDPKDDGPSSPTNQWGDKPKQTPEKEE